MTSAANPEIYPQYCFHLSPISGKWCHLRIADVVALTTHPGFEGQDLYFHINHPVKWVRIAGIVVAVDDFGPWRAYTIDDSSGATIECHVNLPKPNNANPGAVNLAQADKPKAISAEDQRKAELIGAEVNVGDIIDVKGTIRVYRETRQIKAEKIKHLRSTEEEVQFWERITALRKEVLDKPWVLDPKVVRKCRRDAEGYDAQQARREKRERRERRAREKEEEEKRARAARMTEEVGLRRETERTAGILGARKPKIRASGLEKRPKAAKVAGPITGQYSALGL
ncbi:hypothetical protein B0T16DRAFT_333942 [Cercophora newfieldiana]|uniref:CST complex subunit STN1 n=1 Tax=Cercophora newfieldiana TaxID=92897 RepID=A0AA40CJF4_9PEZI|nr:hypothetical protein B0T16DRAFT_333942 [Cercophora newfieldiana]